MDAGGPGCGGAVRARVLALAAIVEQGACGVGALRLCVVPVVDAVGGAAVSPGEERDGSGGQDAWTTAHAQVVVDRDPGLAAHTTRDVRGGAVRDDDEVRLDGRAIGQDREAGGGGCRTGCRVRLTRCGGLGDLPRRAAVWSSVRELLQPDEAGAEAGVDGLGVDLRETGGECPSQGGLPRWRRWCDEGDGVAGLGQEGRGLRAHEAGAAHQDSGAGGVRGIRTFRGVRQQSADGERIRDRVQRRETAGPRPLRVPGHVDGPRHGARGDDETRRLDLLPRPESQTE